MSVQFDKNTQFNSIHTYEELTKSGLTEKQSLVYYSLIELGGTASPSNIASISKIKRPTVYAILDEFDLMGVVKKITQNKKFVYQLQSADQLHKYIREKTKFWQNQYDHLQEILPLLKTITNNLSPVSPIRFFTENNIKNIYEHHLEFSNYTQYGFSSAECAFEMFSKKYLVSYAQRKEKQKIRGQVIMPATDTSKNYKKHMYYKNIKRFEPKVSFIPQNMWSTNTEIVLYADEYISLVTKTNNQWSGIIIHNKDLYTAFFNIFNIALIGTQSLASK